MNHFIRINTVSGYRLLQFNNSANDYNEYSLDDSSKVAMKYNLSRNKLDKLLIENNLLFNIIREGNSIVITYGIYFSNLADLNGRKGIPFLHCIEFENSNYLLPMLNRVFDIISQSGASSLKYILSSLPTFADEGVLVDKLIGFIRGYFVKIQAITIEPKSSKLLTTPFSAIKMDSGGLRWLPYIYYASAMKLHDTVNFEITDIKSDTGFSTVLVADETEFATEISCRDLAYLILATSEMVTHNSLQTVGVNNNKATEQSTDDISVSSRSISGIDIWKKRLHEFLSKNSDLKTPVKRLVPMALLCFLAISVSVNIFQKLENDEWKHNKIGFPKPDGAIKRNPTFSPQTDRTHTEISSLRDSITKLNIKLGTSQFLTLVPKKNKVYHTVKKGETLESIAQTYSVQIDSIIANNPKDIIDGKIKKDGVKLKIK